MKIFAAAILIAIFSVCLDVSAQQGPAQYTNSNVANGGGSLALITVANPNGTVNITGFMTTSNATFYVYGVPYFNTRADAAAMYPAYPCIQQPDTSYVNKSGKTIIVPGGCTPDPRLTNYVIPLGQ